MIAANVLIGFSALGESRLPPPQASELTL